MLTNPSPLAISDGTCRFCNPRIEELEDRILRAQQCPVEPLRGILITKAQKRLNEAIDEIATREGDPSFQIAKSLFSKGHRIKNDTCIAGPCAWYWNTTAPDKSLRGFRGWIPESHGMFRGIPKFWIYEVDRFLDQLTQDSGEPSPVK